MEENLQTILSFLEENKAKDIALFDVRGQTNPEQFIFLANFANCEQNKIFADKVMENLGLTDFPEGYHKGEWIIFMLGDIILHTFIPVKREKYNLDKLYQNEKVNIAKPSKKREK